MSRWVEVTVHASKVFAIEVEDSDDNPEDTAKELAELEWVHNPDEISATAPTADPVEIGRMKRHADFVFGVNY